VTIERFSGRQCRKINHACEAPGAIDQLVVDLDAVIPGLVSDIDGSVTYSTSDDAKTYSVVDEVARRALLARKAPPSWQFPQQDSVAYQNRRLHRLLQPHHGQALPLDHGSKTSNNLSPNESLISARCTRNSPQPRNLLRF
jgi:hypothetical protein